MAAVTSRGYVGILKSVCMTQIEVAPRVYFNYSPSVEHLVLLGAFFCVLLQSHAKPIICMLACKDDRFYMASYTNEEMRSIFEFVSAIARKTNRIAKPCKQKGGMYDPDITRRSKENS